MFRRQLATPACWYSSLISSTFNKYKILRVNFFHPLFVCTDVCVELQLTQISRILCFAAAGTLDLHLLNGVNQICILNGLLPAQNHSKIYVMHFYKKKLQVMAYDQNYSIIQKNIRTILKDSSFFIGDFFSNSVKKSDCTTCVFLMTMTRIYKFFEDQLLALLTV